MGPLNGLLRDWQFILPPQPPLVFTARSYEALFPGAGPLGCVVWPGARIAYSQVSPPDFYPPHMHVGPPVLPATAAATLPPPPCHRHTVSFLPQLPISAPSTHLDEYGLFKSLVVGFPCR